MCSWIQEIESSLWKYSLQAGSDDDEAHAVEGIHRVSKLVECLCHVQKEAPGGGGPAGCVSPTLFASARQDRRGSDPD